ncbi:hypothetical protein RJ639_031032 [Escallonia herrerae]|uniref:Aspergillus nuclease S1 n=1 Tax=Escallonia herrerae TaxID=1293975 RepID=A0AA88XEP5_9ASTE|nr:hypothetical protein RJ639_031032 [Escallonia herrerae]
MPKKYAAATFTSSNVRCTNHAQASLVPTVRNTVSLCVCKNNTNTSVWPPMHTDSYFNSRMPVVMKRIAQGGVRLSMILNRVFGHSHGDGVAAT